MPLALQAGRPKHNRKKIYYRKINQCNTMFFHSVSNSSIKKINIFFYFLFKQPNFYCFTCLNQNNTDKICKVIRHSTNEHSLLYSKTKYSFSRFLALFQNFSDIANYKSKIVSFEYFEHYCTFPETFIFISSR